MSFATGTVGDALKRRALDGLRVEDHGRSLIDWLVPHLYATKGRVLLALRRTDGGEVLRALAEDGVLSRQAFALQLAPDWRARAEAVLREALVDPSEEGWCSMALTERLLEALLPRSLDGRAAWLMTRGLEILRPAPEAPVVEARDRSRAADLAGGGRAGLLVPRRYGLGPQSGTEKVPVSGGLPSDQVAVKEPAMASFATSVSVACSPCISGNNGPPPWTTLM
jgi:hypothetical protein